MGMGRGGRVRWRGRRDDRRGRTSWGVGRSLGDEGGRWGHRSGRDGRCAGVLDGCSGVGARSEGGKVVFEIRFRKIVGPTKLPCPHISQSSTLSGLSKPNSSSITITEPIAPPPLYPALTSLLFFDIQSLKMVKPIVGVSLLFNTTRSPPAPTAIASAVAC